MTYVSAIDNNSVMPKTATYNAVKIQVNNPTANIPAQGVMDGNGTYNGVSIEVNNPSLKTDNNRTNIYDYPYAKSPLMCDMPLCPINIPHIHKAAIAYQTTNYVNNETLVNTELEIENALGEVLKNKAEELFVPVVETVVIEEVTAVPEPNITTPEEQKTSVTFNGISFKQNQPIEIVEPKEIKPEVDVQDVVSNLANPNFDTQAKQMEEIARISMMDSQKAIPYVVTEIFSELINIAEKDTSNLNPPTEKQIETRRQIIVNEIVKEQAKAENKDLTEIELPYKLNQKDIENAVVLSTLEEAERNKEYALYTMAILAKVYVEEVEKQTGNVIPLTDLPGIATIVDTLRYNNNSGVKIAAVDALRYMNKDEYKEEIISILSIVANDKNPYVAKNAAMAIESIN